MGRRTTTCDRRHLAHQLYTRDQDFCAHPPTYAAHSAFCFAIMYYLGYCAECKYRVLEYSTGKGTCPPTVGHHLLRNNRPTPEQHTQTRHTATQQATKKKEHRQHSAAQRGIAQRGSAQSKPNLPKQSNIAKQHNTTQMI